MARILDTREDPRTLGALRIGIGLCLLGDIASLLPHTAYLYGDAGVAPAATSCGGALQGISLLCVLPGEAWSTAILGLGCVASITLALGLWTRASKWIVLVVLGSIVLRNPLPLAGQQVLGSFLFLLCLSRCGAAYSLDNLRRCQRLRVAGELDDGAEAHATYRPIPAWPRWLMILQLTVAYTVAGWAKIGQSYVDGSSFFNLLGDGRWNRFPQWGMLRLFGDNLIRLATWIAWGFERYFALAALGLVLRRFAPSLPRWLLWPTSRWIWTSLSLVFAGTLTLLANVGWFVPATAAATLVLFRGEEVGRVVDRILRRRAHAPPSIAADHTAPLWRRTLLAAFIAWHSLAMLANSLNRGHLKIDLPAPVSRAAWYYKNLTGARQFWWMFAPNARAIHSLVEIEVIDRDGRAHPTLDHRALVGEEHYPYIFIDRRRKIMTNIGGRPRWQNAHAEHLCRTWRDAADRPPAEVIIRRRHGPIPSAEELGTIPRGGESAAIAAAARVDDLLRRSCAP